MIFIKIFQLASLFILLILNYKCNFSLFPFCNFNLLCQIISLPRSVNNTHVTALRISKYFLFHFIFFGLSVINVEYRRDRRHQPKSPQVELKHWKTTFLFRNVFVRDDSDKLTMKMDLLASDVVHKKTGLSWLRLLLLFASLNQISHTKGSNLCTSLHWFTKDLTSFFVLLTITLNFLLQMLFFETFANCYLVPLSSLYI